ncbi:hypothetical protein MAM1_0019c01727 [Mucor ambiguus]|uniref:Uncharacterized protein n=1 Tax=Mucor ambiguus TaxID=91626 RepID=A0A0C9M6E7_9FUNG|nr:hypothetical protein MAM1_0019c01727 [Mucor ambiguus]
MVSTRKTLDAHFLLSHIEFPQSRVDYRAIFDENDPEKFAFVKLLEAINLRASEMSRLQSTFPKMDLSALYCLGITIQEYVRHLSTNVLEQKRAAENKPSIDSFYTPLERQARTLEAVIQKYKPQTSTIAHVQHPPPVTARPNINQELHYSAKHPYHRVEIKTSKKATRYDKMISDPKWTGATVKTPRNLKANLEQAAARRAKAEAIQKMKAVAQQALLEKQQQLQEEKELLMPRKRVRSAEDDTNHDIFDKANHKKPKKSKASFNKQRKTASSSQKGF